MTTQAQPSRGGLPDPVGWVRGEIGRNVHRTANGVRLLAGLDRPRTNATPHVVLWRRGRTTLRRYRAGIGGGGRPMLVVPSLINRSHIWDLRPGDSFVELLLGLGYDVFLIDWGVADDRDAGNTIGTYVDDHLPAAYAEVIRAAGRPPVVMGHCFGGVLAVLWAASVAEQPPALVALGVPTNWTEMGPLAQLTQFGRLEPEDVLDDTGNVPPGHLLRAFQMLRPLGDVNGYVTLWQRLDDRRAAQAIQALSGWAHDHVPFPGAAFIEMVHQLSRENGLYTGSVALDGRVRQIADIKCPFLSIYGTHDHITPPASVQPLGELVGSESARTVAVKAGHIGLLVGGSARRQTLPTIAGWLSEHLGAPRADAT